MPSGRSRTRECRVSSQTTNATAAQHLHARAVTSPRFPMGVAHEVECSGHSRPVMLSHPGVERAGQVLHDGARAPPEHGHHVEADHPPRAGRRLDR